MVERIEILSVSLLDEHRPLVNELKRLARSLNLEFGWHYLLDLVWIIRQLGEVSGKRIVDAGAGTGILQWHLAQQGAEVISVDRMSRANLPPRFHNRFQVRGLRPEDLRPQHKIYLDGFRKHSKIRVMLTAQSRDLLGMASIRRASGRVLIYNHDLKNMPDIADNSLDAIVSVSALEHNDPGDLKNVVGELMRVLKPGGSLLATLCAARDADAFHAPSHGWCYTEASLRRFFDLAPSVTSNYAQYGQLFAELATCTELRDNLARFYFQSGDNGMPWGKWDPQYQPVGICKVKS